MTSTSGAVFERRSLGVVAPLAFALGGALVISSGVGATPLAQSWTTTSVGQEAFSRAPSTPAADQTSSGLPQVGAPSADRPAVPLGRRIAEIRALSGLTTDQVGRLFGVSRRSVHNWISGNAMASQHEERAARILSILQDLPASTPAERRSAMLDSSRGASLFHKLVATVTEAQPLQVAGLTARDRIGL